MQDTWNSAGAEDHFLRSLDFARGRGAVGIACSVNMFPVVLTTRRRGSRPKLAAEVGDGGSSTLAHVATLTSILPKFLPCNTPRKEAGAFSSPSTMSSRY
jgi:hypothetical protein